MNKYFLIPQLLSGVRIVFAFIFLFLFLNNLIIISIIIFHIGWVTDILDGICARKFEVTSTFGAYFDATSDFILISIAFLAFIITEIFPFWVLLIIGLMFIQFIITSRFKKPIFDPIGRYTGVFLFIIIGITIILSDPVIYDYLLLGFIIFVIIALISRIITFKKRIDRIW